MSPPPASQISVNQCSALSPPDTLQKVFINQPHVLKEGITLKEIVV